MYGQAADPLLVRDALFVVSTLEDLKRYNDAVRKAAAAGAPPPADKLVARVSRVLAELIFFATSPVGADEQRLLRLAGGGGGTRAAVAAALDREGLPVPARQSYLREQGLIPVLVAAIKSPWREFSGKWRLRELLRDGGAKGALRRVADVSRLACRLVFHIFKDNRANEMAVADFLDVFIKLVGYELRAEQTLTHLLTNNRQLLQQLQPETCRVFIDLIRRKGKRAHYIDFLVGLCSCLGEPVKSKQELVADVIFGDDDGKYDRDDQTVLGVTSPEDPGAAVVIPMRRQEGSADTIEVFIDTVGFLPQEMRDAAAKEGDAAGSWMTLAGFFNTDADHLLLAAKRRLRRQQREYLVSQISLCVEMCLGRNYLAIREIEVMLPRACVGAVVRNARRSSAEHLIATKAPCCTATAGISLSLSAPRSHDRARCRGACARRSARCCSTCTSTATRRRKSPCRR